MKMLIVATSANSLPKEMAVFLGRRGNGAQSFMLGFYGLGWKQGG